NLDAITHTFFATLHVLFQPADIIHYHGVGPSTLAFIPRLFRIHPKVVTTFHSRDRFHAKWGLFAKLYLALGEWTSVVFPHATIAASHAIQLFARLKFKRHVWYIPNGVEIPEHHPGSAALGKLGLEPNGYFYTLCRMVPHKALEDAIVAFKGVETDKKLAIIGFAGENRVEKGYLQKLEKLAKNDGRIIFMGKRVGSELHQLMANAYVMIHPSRSEGLSVSVLEAMSYGKLVVMSDIPENLELIDHSGISFKLGDVENLRDVLQWLVADPEIVAERGARAKRIVAQLYSWDSVVHRTEALYSSLQPYAAEARAHAVTD
ncbi:MAG: glycosyltransferase family 4 protein, partial [Alphaproteobacteria bacterium]|nr:glycosyltransferase family 4 protein [Alphaproteobacteria bacterium]